MEQKIGDRSSVFTVLFKSFLIFSTSTDRKTI
jgi:hypothetical protein